MVGLHAVAEAQDRRIHAEHSSERTCHVRGIGEAGRMRRDRQRLSGRERDGGTFELEPQEVWAERKAHRVGENVHEAARRQSRLGGQ